jgi:alcohol dehydrogenase
MKDHTREEIKFTMKSEMIVGTGSAKNLPKLLRERGWIKVALVIDSAVLQHNPYAREIVDIVTGDLDKVILVRAEMPEPTYDYLDQVKSAVQGQSLDCVIGIGGGSTIDVAKGLATLVMNPGPAIQYRGFGKVVHQPLPVVALPTTAGSGSEVTYYAAFIDTIEKRKFGINSEYNYPRLAFYDSGFLDSCPLKTFASSGMDAMVHTIESYVARTATAISRIFSIKAFDLLFPNLSKIADGDRSPGTKLNLLLGSGLAGVALMNSGSGPAGALSYPLGVHFKVPHGLAGSVFLAPVIEFNVTNGYTAYSELYDRMPSAETGLNEKEKAMRFAQKIRDLSRRLGVPTNLAGFGVTTDQDMRLIIDNALQMKPPFELNPVPFGEVQIDQTVRALGTN